MVLLHHHFLVSVFLGACAFGQSVLGRNLGLWGPAPGNALSLGGQVGGDQTPFGCSAVALFGFWPCELERKQ